MKPFSLSASWCASCNPASAHQSKTERVLCYECYTALNAMRFFAKKGDEQAYQWTRQRILQLLQHSA